MEIYTTLLRRDLEMTAVKGLLKTKNLTFDLYNANKIVTVTIKFFLF